MLLRILGNMNERYIAIGLSDTHDAQRLLSMKSDEIKKSFTRSI